jgi:hypothetical protein
MLMSLVSLTWEIKGQPNCARKQVCLLGLSIMQCTQVHVLNLFLLLTERRGTFPLLGHNARICHDVAE